MESFSKNSLITLFTEVLVFIIGFFSLVIISRTLGPEGRGIYSLIILIPGLIITFGSLGLESANVYFTGSKKYKVKDVASNSLILSIIIGLILIFIFFVISQFDFFQKFLQANKISSFYLWMVVSIIPMSLLLGFFRNIIRGRGEILNYNKIRILENSILLLGIVGLLLIFKKDIFGAILSNAIATLFATLYAIFFITKITKLHFSLNKKLFKDSIIYGGKVYFANSISFLSYRLDMLLIAMLLTPAAVGFYSIAVAISERLFMIPGALATVLLPKVSSIESVEANDLTPRVSRHTFFIMVITSLLLIILANPLIRFIFGSDFLPSIIPLIILLPGIIAFGIGGVLAADLGGRGRPEFAVYSSTVCLIANIVLNIFLIPKWGISGAAFASSVAYWLDTIIIIIAFSRISKKSLGEILLIRIQDFQDYYQIFPIIKNYLWKVKK